MVNQVNLFTSVVNRKVKTLRWMSYNRGKPTLGSSAENEPGEDLVIKCLRIPAIYSISVNVNINSLDLQHHLISMYFQ